MVRSVRGYKQEDSVAYYRRRTSLTMDMNEEDQWYDEEYDEWLDPMTRAIKITELMSY
jgi:predicted alpha/beta hydrolase family esterase